MKTSIASVVWIALMSVPAAAQCGTSVLPDLVAPDATAGDLFGETVRTDGTRAIVGGYGRDVAGIGADVGKVWIWRFEAGAWVYEADLVAPDAGADDHFGRSASIDGDAALVGSYQDDLVGSNSGSAHVFRRVAGSWAHEQKLTPLDGAATDRFGRVVAVRGNTAFIGAPFDDDAGADVGSAYVFEFDGTSWIQAQKLLPPAAGANDRYGKAFSIGENCALIGSSRTTGGVEEAGAAYAYRFDGTDWVLETILAPPVPTPFERAGTSVAIDGPSGSEIAVVGAFEYTDALGATGAAYVFRRVGGAWEYEGRLLASDRANGDAFGWTVAVSNGVVLVGAVFEGETGLNRAGAAYVFRKLGASWVETQKLVAPMRHANEELGASIWLGGTHALLGAHKYASSTGRVVAFEIEDECVRPFCFGDGSGTACPCSNDSAPGSLSGCLNSFAQAGRLTASGTASLTADTLTFQATGLPDSTALLFQGDTSIESGSVFGDGLRCANGNVVRLERAPAVGGVFTWPLAAEGPVSLEGGVTLPGSLRSYQVWYRNSADYCTSSTYNLTNGLEVTWQL